MTGRQVKKAAGMERPLLVVRNAQRKVRLNARRLEEFALHAWEACDRLPASAKWPSGEISVVFVSDRIIAEMHDRFMGVRGPTDVITFQHGEIVISAETARRQARAYRSSLGEELQLYIIHGLLHLRGYDDKTLAGSREMRRLQNSILRRLAD
jgi:probable rRNA maturation factor